MPVQTFEPLPPQVRAVRFDGTNAAEVATLVGHAGALAPQTDGGGPPYLTLTRLLVPDGEIPLRIEVGAWVAMDERGTMIVQPGTEAAPDGWRAVATPAQAATAPAPAPAAASGRKP